VAHRGRRVRFIPGGASTTTSGAPELRHRRGPPATWAGVSLVHVGADFFTWSAQLPATIVLWCGRPLRSPLSGAQPVVSEEAFAAATAVEEVETDIADGRVAALRVADRRFPGQTLLLRHGGVGRREEQIPLMQLETDHFRGDSDGNRHTDANGNAAARTIATSPPSRRRPQPRTSVRGRTAGCQVDPAGGQRERAPFCGLLPFLLRRRRD